MNRLIYLLVVITLGLAAPTVSVSVDRNKINEGDSITLTVTAKGGEDSPEVDISFLNKDFKVVSGPNQSMNMQWVNGKLSSTNSLSWTLMPRRKGTFTIPQLSIEADGKKFKSNPIDIVVYDRGTSQSGGNGKMPASNFFIEATLDKDSVYRGEQLTVTYTLYTSVDLTGFDIQDIPRFKGFWKDEIYSPRSNLQLREVRRAGKRFKAATVKKVALFPTTSGDMEIEPLTAIVSVQVRDKNFNWSFFSRSKSYTVASNSLEVLVKPLPAFDGDVSASVGTWNVRSSLSSEEIRQDEAVTLTIEVWGAGNLQSVDVNDIDFPAELEVFEPEISINQSQQNDLLSGKKTIEYVLIPREAKEIEIPPIEMTYFDLKTEAWKTRRTRPIQLSVLPSDRVFGSTAGLTKEEVQIMGKDIRFAEFSNPKWRRIDAGLISVWTVTLYGSSILFFLLPGLINITNSRRTATQGSRRARKALAHSISCLPEPGGDPESSYRGIVLAFNTYLDDKMDHQAQRSTQEIMESLRVHGISERTFGTLDEILSRGNAVRFAPVSDSDVIRDIQQTREIFEEVDNDWK